MKKQVLWFVAALLAIAGLASAQSGGSSSAGGGLSTKAILALENCFDDFDAFICSGTGTVGPGTADRIAKFTAATTIGDSNLTDNGTSLSGSYGGTIGLTATGDVTLTSSDEIFLSATADVNIPDDVELIFGTTATVGGPAEIRWNTFSGAGFERLEIDSLGNAGMLITVGDVGAGGFSVTDGSGTFIHTFTQNPPPAAGTSFPSWAMSVTAPTSMDSSDDQRVGLDLDMESGTTDVAGSQQIGFLIESTQARASTQDAIVIGAAGWDNEIVFGDETNRTALNWAAASGSNVVTVPAATGTLMVGTGTAGNLTRWTGTNTIGDSSAFDDGTNVRIPRDTALLFGDDANDGAIYHDGVSNLYVDGNSGGDNVTIHAGNVRRVDFSFGGTSFDLGPADATTVQVLDWGATAGVSAEILRVGATDTAPIMNGSDTLRAIDVQFTNANHTGTGNELHGLSIRGITADADATEDAINIGGGFDYGVHFQGTAQNPGGGNHLSALYLDETLTSVAAGTYSRIRMDWTSAADGGETVYGLYFGDTAGLDFAAHRDVFHDSNTVNLSLASNRGFGFTIDDDVTQDEWNVLFQSASATGASYVVISNLTVPTMDGNDSVTVLGGSLTNANHTGTGNTLQFFQAAQITGDADAVESAIDIPSGWDYFLKTDVQSASPQNPGANEVGLFIDENTDRVGTATNDCALVARLSDGTEINVAILVTDGGCP